MPTTVPRNRIGGTDVTTATSARWSASLLAAVSASQVGAVLLVAFLCAYNVVVFRAPLLSPLQIYGSYRYGDAALIQLHAGGYAWAFAFVMGTCALWGLVYGLLATALRVDKDRWAPIALGVIVGLAAQIVDINLVTPRIMQALWGHDMFAENMRPVSSWVGHVLFGLGFAAFPALFRSMWLRFSNRGDLLADDPRIR